MKLNIQPGTDSLDALLTANAYRQLWDTHGAAICMAFTEVTGLTFQQDAISVQVLPHVSSTAGDAGHPMILSADYSTPEIQVITLIHELAHRLLGGNALSPIGLGLIPDSPDFDLRFQEFEHRHIYLFLHDVVLAALGGRYAQILTQDESKTEATDYKRAWRWAMDMNPERRKRAVRKLADEALPRNRWHERDDRKIPQRDPDEWFALLTSG